MIGSEIECQKCANEYHQYMSGVDELTVTDDDGMFSSDSFVCYGSGEVDCKKCGFGQFGVAWSVRCFEENFSGVRKLFQMNENRQDVRPVLSTLLSAKASGYL